MVHVFDRQKVSFFRFFTLSWVALLIVHALPAQVLPTKADSLRGMLTPLRTCYDVTEYRLDLRVDPAEKWISGTCTIHMRILDDSREIQLDLAENMAISDIRDGQGKKLKFTREINTVIVEWRKVRQKGEYASMEITYAGRPKEARNPPWDGGFTWTTDTEGNPWVVVTCQGLGASTWWPTKDHQSDEPDSMQIAITVPPGLMDVSNGRLIDQVPQPDGWTRYVWKVHSPINNYNVTLNIGQYRHFRDWHVNAEGDSLSLDYYVLPNDLAKAKVQFKQVGPMLDCYEAHLGPYPFPEDGFKLVQSPHPGMEHQSAIAYGNHFENGYRGRSQSAEGKWFDYIIIHESAHEWFGNSISAADIADMWIHESFGTYMEAVYVECLYGTEAATRYMEGLKKEVLLDRPIVGTYGVNQPGSRDMYPKGALMLHTLRYVVANDALWWTALNSLSLRFRHSIVSYQDIIGHLNQSLGEDYAAFFYQYLNKVELPVLEYDVVGKGRQQTVRYRLISAREDLQMPIQLLINDSRHRINASAEWKSLVIDAGRKMTVRMDPNWFVRLQEFKG